MSIQRPLANEPAAGGGGGGQLAALPHNNYLAGIPEGGEIVIV